MLALLAEGLPRAIDEGDTLRTVADHAEHVPRRAAGRRGGARGARRRSRKALEAEEIQLGISMLVGGRIGDGPLKLYRLYSEGNFIECQTEQPFLQIGETKYGKPILDRALQIRDAALRDGEGRADLVRFDDALEPRGRPPARSDRDPLRSARAR